MRYSFCVAVTISFAVPLLLAGCKGGERAAEDKSLSAAAAPINALQALHSKDPAVREQGAKKLKGVQDFDLPRTVPILEAALASEQDPKAKAAMEDTLKELRARKGGQRPQGR